MTSYPCSFVFHIPILDQTKLKRAPLPFSGMFHVCDNTGEGEDDGQIFMEEGGWRGVLQSVLNRKVCL